MSTKENEVDMIALWRVRRGSVTILLGVNLAESAGAAWNASSKGAIGKPGKMYPGARDLK